MVVISGKPLMEALRAITSMARWNAAILTRVSITEFRSERRDAEIILLRFCWYQTAG
jgi:hypothetical protein